MPVRPPGRSPRAPSGTSSCAFTSFRFEVRLHGSPRYLTLPALDGFPDLPRRVEEVMDALGELWRDLGHAGQLRHRRGLDAAGRAERLQQAGAHGRPHAGNLVQHGRDGAALAQLLVVADREAMRL